MKRKIQPHLFVGEGDVAEYVLLTGDPKRVGMMAELLDDARKVAEFRHYVTYSGKFRGIDVTINGTGIGAPATAIAVEELANVGGRVFIRVGTTGALQPDIAIGDLVIASGAMRYDGATKQYAPIEMPAVADPIVTYKMVDAARRLRVPYHIGVIWTSDAFYAESGDLVKRMSQMKVKSVEMECSAIFVLCQLRGLHGGGILVASDNLVLGVRKGEMTEGQQPVEHSEKVVKGIKSATQVALEAMEDLRELGA